MNFYGDRSENTNFSCLVRFVALESDAGEFHEAMNTLNMGDGDIKSTLRVISINLHFRNKKFLRFYQDSFFLDRESKMYSIFGEIY